MPTKSSTKLAALRQKELGAFYTPQAIAETLVEWAIRNSDDRALDPSFGGLVFLRAAQNRLETLGATKEQAKARVHGIELDRTAYEAAVSERRSKSANLVWSDFFAVMPGEHLPPCQAVIGNPPYVRYQGFNGAGHAGHQLAAAAGVSLTRLASSWAPFVVHAVAFLATGGRLALVLPAEVIHAQYAEPVLDFLRRNFSQISIAVFEERVFPGALEEIVLLFADGRGNGPAAEINLASCQTLDDLKVGDQEQRPLSATPGAKARGKLLAQLLPKATQSLYWRLCEEEQVLTLGQWGSIDIGAVTGANGFFLLSDEEAAQLPDPLLRPTVSKAHQIAGTIFTAVDLVALREDGGKAQMFVAEANTDPALIEAAKSYLARGKRQGLAKRYKCRVREPWWAVPLPKHGVPDLFLTYFASEHPRLVVNGANALHTNTIHGLKLRDPRRARSLATGFYNSLTLLSAELTGRSYGGGVLKLEPTEAEALLMPSLPPRLGRKLPQLDRLIRFGELNQALDLVDQLVLVEGLGLSTAQVRSLRRGAERLRQRRRARGRKPR